MKIWVPEDYSPPMTDEMRSVVRRLHGNLGTSAPDMTGWTRKQGKAYIVKVYEQVQERAREGV
jgi:hypothetical protein